MVGSWGHSASLTLIRDCLMELWPHGQLQEAPYYLRFFTYISSNLFNNLWYEYYTEQNIEAQRGQVICDHITRRYKNLDLNSGSSDSKAWVFPFHWPRSPLWKSVVLCCDISFTKVVGKWASQKAFLACSCHFPFLLSEINLFFFFWLCLVIAVLKLFGLRSSLHS